MLLPSPPTIGGYLRDQFEAQMHRLMRYQVVHVYPSYSVSRAVGLDTAHAEETSRTRQAEEQVSTSPSSVWLLLDW